MENSNCLDSQTPGSTCSLSLPSEPPDVGNWLASYAYESPVLNTSDYFEDSVFRNSEEFVSQESTKEKENNLDEFRKTESQDELGFVIRESNPSVFTCNPKIPSRSQVLDSSYIPSQVSEPPGIGKWFSSYVYESFVLDTNDDVKESISQESECKKEEFVTEKSKKEENMATIRETRRCNEVDVGKEICSNGFVKGNGRLGDDKPRDNQNKSLSKSSISLDSHSVFTEPPDVKNWFSSYVYESPVLSTSDEIGVSLYLERESEKDEFVVEDSDEEKEETLVTIRKVRSTDEECDVKKVHSNGLVKHNSSFKVDERENESIRKGVDRIGGKESPSSQNNLLSNNSSDKSNGITPCKDVEESIYNDEGSMSKDSKLVQQFSQESCPVSSNINRSFSTSKQKSPTKLAHRTDFINESLQANTPLEDVNTVLTTSKPKISPVREASSTKQAHARNDKENGFVATRKNEYIRTDCEDSLQMAQEFLLECTRNKGTVSSLAGEKDDFFKRKALVETPNFQHSDTVEITGEWRCPQKTTPNRGPPLKQLRLERWIHKV